MELVYNRIFLEHKSQNHPERPERLLAFGDLMESKLESGEKYLKSVHDPHYIELVRKACEDGMSLEVDTYTNRESFEVACRAVGAAIKAAKHNDFALVRPPGHHATRNKAMGFCIFNSIAVACKWLNERGKKVLLLDIDSHSGNGSQEIFYCTDEVLYVSLHQYPAYPGTGWVTEVGKDKGKYFTINIPFPPFTGDDLFTGTLAKIIPAIKDRYKPDAVAVSAGFDGHREDPLLDMNLSVNSYYEAGKLLASNFRSVFACLEGGYNINVLPHCVSAFLSGVNNESNSLKFKEPMTNSAANVEREFGKRMQSLRTSMDGFWGF